MNTREAITQLLFVDDQPEPVDLVMVLGCPLLCNMDPAIDYFRKGLSQRILISGHGPVPSMTPEWWRYRQYALAQGIPESALLLEKDSTNTLENFIFSERLINTCIGWENIHSLAIITKPLHTRRALMTARKMYPKDLRLIMGAPTLTAEIISTNWWETEAHRRRVLDEVRRIGEYALKEHLADD